MNTMNRELQDDETGSYVTAWIPEHVKETLRKLAKKERRSLSNYCAGILEQHYQNHTQQQSASRPESLQGTVQSIS